MAVPRVDTVVYGGQGVTSSRVAPGCIAIKDGKIVAMGDESLMPDAARSIGPLVRTRSSALASSTSAASFRIFTFTRLPASRTALPPTAPPRLPYDPIPNGMSAVSPWTTETVSMSMPSSWAQIWASVVSRPCPRFATPE